VENYNLDWVSNLSVDYDRWQHIALVFDPGAKTTKIYKNCGLSGSESKAGLNFPNHNNNIFVGCDRSDTDCFQGRMDEVQVHNRVLSESEILAACSDVPQLMLHMEDPYGIKTFLDDSQIKHEVTCLDPTDESTCPKAGINGQMGLAFEFDGINDGLKTNYTLSNHEGTIMLWARADSSGDLPQTLIGSYGTNKMSLYRENGTWKLRMGPGVILAPADARVRTGEWQHLAIVISNSGAGTQGCYT
jgi:hypothetical protein